QRTLYRGIFVPLLSSNCHRPHAQFAFDQPIHSRPTAWILICESQALPWQCSEKEQSVSENKLAKRNFSDRLLWAGFGAAIVAAVLVGWTADKDANESYAWSTWITHTQDVLGVLDDTRGNTLAALAAIQDYYRSGDLKNLDRIINIGTKLKQQSAVLRSVT